MPTSHVAIDEADVGSQDKFTATYSISEDSKTKEIQRLALNTQAGAEIVIPSVGQSNMAGSTPVVLASDQTAIPVTNASSTTIKLDVPARPGDTAAYTINDFWSDSTTAPTAGGFTITGAGRISGGSGIIVDACVMSNNNPGTPLQGEIHIFDQAVTNGNDNTAFGVTDAEVKNWLGKIPFGLENLGNNGACYVPGLNLAYTCVGSANLRFLIRVKNAYTPAAGEILSLALKIMHTS